MRGMLRGAAGTVVAAVLRGDAALGVATDSFGVQRVVRLEWR